MCFMHCCLCLPTGGLFFCVGQDIQVVFTRAERRLQQQPSLRQTLDGRLHGGHGHAQRVGHVREGRERLAPPVGAAAEIAVDGKVPHGPFKKRHSRAGGTLRPGPFGPARQWRCAPCVRSGRTAAGWWRCAPWPCPGSSGRRTNTQILSVLRASNHRQRVRYKA